MLEVGELITLTNDKDYLVVNTLELHSTNYAYLMTIKEPLEIIISTVKDVNGSIVLEEVKDKSEIEYIMNQFSTNIESK